MQSQPGITAVSGAHDSKRPFAEAGEMVALGKLDGVKTGDTLSTGKTAPPALAEIAGNSPLLGRVGVGGGRGARATSSR